MKKQIIQRLSLLLILLSGAIFSGRATGRLAIDVAGIEPGETCSIPFSLENSSTFYGFQADIEFPAGLAPVQTDGRPDVTLSSRFDGSFQLVTNILADGRLRVLAFSLTHQAISGSDGPLFYISAKAADSFAGGVLAATDISLVAEGDIDVPLPDVSVELGTEHDNRFYINDFKIAVGETKSVGLILDNETGFTAFQTDLYLPEGITVEPGSGRMTSRGGAGHTVEMKSFPDGRTRIACFSAAGTAFSGNSGTLLTIELTAGQGAPESGVVEMRNSIFSTPNAREYRLPDSKSTVTVERVLVESITVSPTEVSLMAGETETLTATVLPAFISTRSLSWNSDNETVATVSAAGVVTAVSPGTCTVTAAATDGSGVRAACSVTVTPRPVESISLDRSTASLEITGTVQLTASVLPAEATDKTVVWTSADETIATVDENGLVTAFAVGKTIITAASQSDPEVTAGCEITVKPTRATSMELNHSEVTLKVNETVVLTATFFPEWAVKDNVDWKSSAIHVATVLQDGTVTARAVGSAVITATNYSGTLSATCRITVEPTPAESVTITADKPLIMRDGQGLNLTATVLPETTTNKTLTWTSSDEDVATVSSSDMFTNYAYVSAHGKVGKTTITARTENGIEASVEITVEPTPAETVSLGVWTETVNVGDSFIAIVSVFPENATDKTVIWSVSDTRVLSLSEGETPREKKLTAIAPGTAVIKVETTDGSGLSDECTVTVKGESGIDEVSADGISVSVEGNSVVVGRDNPETAVRLLRISGMEVAPESVSEGRVVFGNLARGCYIVVLGSRAMKVVI